MYPNKKNQPLNGNASKIRKSKFAAFCLTVIKKVSQQIEKEVKHFLENEIKANLAFR